MDGSARRSWSHVARSRVVWDDKSLANTLRNSPAKLDLGMTAILERSRPRAERYMKSNAPWTDRTGNARQGLHATVQRERLRLYALVLAHTVEYGIWLEVTHGGQNRIIEPSVRNQGDAIMRDISGLFGQVFG
jgi:hypothetical protein